MRRKTVQAATSDHPPFILFQSLELDQVVQRVVIDCFWS